MGLSFFLRPRGRAVVVLVVFGLPLFLAMAGAQFVPEALWFDELGQIDVFRRTIEAKVQLFVLAGLGSAIFVGANLSFAVSRANMAWTSWRLFAVSAASFTTVLLLGSAAAGHWQAYLLWRHRQPFGVRDPIHGQDIGFFVFSLPFHRVISGLLLVLVAVTAGHVALAYYSGGAVGIRPFRLAYSAQTHFAALAAIFLLVLAWRFRLQQYGLELGQPSANHGSSFAGASYTDVHVRSPGLQGLAIFTAVCAFAVLLVPRLARGRQRRRVALLAGAPVAAVALGLVLVTAWLPALVQRYMVDPNPVLSEGPFLEHSIGATRTALGLATIEVEEYAPTGSFDPAAVTGLRERLANVLVWDSWLLEARMRELVAETPYYRPEPPTYDVARVDGRRQLTIASARELDVRRVRGADRWINDRLAYTHGLGLARFSGTDVESDRQPRLLDRGLGIRQPRIYYGDFPRGSPSWVVVDTRRPEVDIPASEGAPATSYHYDGTGGIELSNWFRRAVFALDLGSLDVLISDDLTPSSRILLHRDVHNRLRTLAPFIQWDSNPVPLAVGGRILFLVDGYTTSASYPYAQSVELGRTHVNYARASVRATVDAFSGRVDLYLVDSSDPIARAWAEAFPTLFRTQAEMPPKVRAKLRYPFDLFSAQASAYEHFHVTRPDRFASEADVWSRPISLSGAIEVAGDVDFDEDDEDNLRATMDPGYKFSPPPGQTQPVLLLETVYSPRGGQNLVGTLSGWIDENGRSHLAARSLPRDLVTLGPAQVSRLVFATPRVRNLLGLRNLEIRDLDKSSLDAVVLGDPHLVFLPGGVLQIQTLYEGSRGLGAARLLGVTAFLNGRAGLAPDIEGAVRQALNKPPQIHVLRPSGPTVVRTPVELRFDVSNGLRQTITITSPAGTETATLALTEGRGTVVWYPSVPGRAEVRVEAEGLDGTIVTDRTAFEILSPAPTVRMTGEAVRAVVGRPMRLSFDVTNARTADVRVSTLAGIEFARRYLIQNGAALVEWTPTIAGPAKILIRVRGGQGQTARKALSLNVASAPQSADAPTVTLVRVPSFVTVGAASRFVFHATGALLAVAEISPEDSEGDALAWRFPDPDGTVAFSWTPPRRGRFVLTVSAQGKDGTTTQATTTLTAQAAS